MHECLNFLESVSLIKFLMLKIWIASHKFNVKIFKIRRYFAPNDHNCFWEIHTRDLSWFFCQKTETFFLHALNKSLKRIKHICTKGTAKGKEGCQEILVNVLFKFSVQRKNFWNQNFLSVPSKNCTQKRQIWDGRITPSVCKFLFIFR